MDYIYIFASVKFAKIYVLLKMQSRIVYLIFFFIGCIPIAAKENAFFASLTNSIHADSITHHLQLWTKEEITDEIFSGSLDIEESIHEEQLRCTQYGSFTPPIVLQGLSKKRKYKGKAYYIRNKDFIVVFTNRCYSLDRRVLMEDMANDRILIVCSKEGTVIDYKIVSRDSELDCTYALNGKIEPMTIAVEQYSLPVFKYSLYNDLPFIVTTHEYSITDEGLIVDRVVGTPKNEIRKPRFPAKKDAPFKGLLALFQQWQKSSLDRSVFCSPSEEGNRLEVGREYEHLIPGFLNRTIETEEIWWKPGQYIELDSAYILFATRICNPSYPCCEFRIMTYTKEGKPIDSRCISREGDIWQDDIKASAKPLAVAVRQWEIDGREVNEATKHPKVTTTLFSIGQDGKITEQPLREDNCPSCINLKTLRTEWSNN